MTANVFKELLKYASYTEKTPRENIFTGSFVFLLKENANLKNHFVTDLLRRYKQKYKGISLPNVSADDLTVLSQTSHFRRLGNIEINRDQIDVEIGDEKNKFGVFIENKIGASLGVKQDVRYRRSLDKKYKNGILAFITLSGAQPIKEGIRHIQLRWADIYDIFKAFLKKETDKTSRYLLVNFLEYMKEENMSSFEGLTRNDPKGNQWLQSYVLQNKLETVLSNIMSYFEAKKYIKTNFKANRDDMFFSIIPESTRHQPKIYRKWKKNWAQLRFGVYPYFSEIWQDEYDNKHKTGLWAYVWVWGRNSFDNSKQLFRKLKRMPGSWHDQHEILIEFNLSDLFGQIVNPKEQEKRMRDFYFKSLETLRRAGVFRMLCR